MAGPPIDTLNALPLMKLDVPRLQAIQVLTKLSELIMCEGVEMRGRKTVCRIYTGPSIERLDRGRQVLAIRSYI